MSTGRIPITTLLIFTLLGCVSFAQSENLLRNPSFERVRDGRPMGWTPTTWNGQAEFSVDDNGRTGRCVRISSKRRCRLVATWS